MFFKKKKFELSTHEAEQLLAKELEPHLDEVLSEFYAWVVETPELKAIVDKTRGERSIEDMVQHLKNAQRNHWLQRLRHGNTPEYRERVTTIGQAHMRIQLDIDHFVQGYELVMNTATQSITDSKAIPNSHKCLLVKTLQHVIMQDLNLITQAYLKAVSDKSDNKLQRITDQLNGQVTESVNTIAGATEELSSTAQSISTQIEDNTKRVNVAVQQSEEATTTAENMAHMAEKINEVIDFINELSEQTNLLALNASIEAARAGEAGRGFSVVADEVRKLASETDTSSEDIRKAIEKLQVLVSQADSSLGNIVTSVDSINGEVQTVAAASTEQSSMIEETSSTIEQFNMGMEQSAAAVQQNDEASQALAAEADNLTTEVQRFKV